MLGVGSASAASVALTLPKGEVILHAEGDCYFAFGSSPTVTAATGYPLIAGEKWAIRLASGQRIAAIQKTAGSNLYIIPVA